MPFSLIDYSERYYKAIAGGLMPENRTGKFIQAMNYETDMEYIVMSPMGLSVYHAHIAEKFLSEMGISGYYNRKGDKYYINTSEWDITGGGIWELDGKNKNLSFSGKSLAYGDFSPFGLKEKIIAANLFAGYTVFVNGG